MQKIDKNKGITLIALVITVIVLLILAGISISMLTGDNSILAQAGNAVAETDVSNTKEQIKLEIMGSLDENGTYTDEDVTTAVKNVLGSETTIVEDGEGNYTVTTAKGNIVDISDLMNEAVSTKINWSEILSNLADEEERKEYLEDATSQGQSVANADIGIGTDGQVVNLDLWNYYTNGDSTIQLGFHYGGSDFGVGYKGTITDGAIEGTIPQYIYISAKDTIYTVTELWATFQGLTSLTVAPEIPDTVTTLYSTFNGCNLTSVTIPDSVTTINYYAFYNCKFTNIKLGSYVETVGVGIFDCCPLLSEVIIEPSVTYIGGYVFSGTNSLTQINYNGTVSQWETIEKSSYWSNSSYITKIICTDGEVTL